MSQNFQIGVLENDTWYPALKTVQAAIVSQIGHVNSVFYDYQPGNGTRYEVLFNSFMTKYGRRTVMTLVNFNASMELNGSLGMASIGYMREKLGMLEGDCYALIQLVNMHLEELGQ